ncbi:MAG: DUF4276 family protein [Thermodesulfobacteriota bacterium]
MRIAFIVEGKTERALVKYLKEFLRPRLPKQMPKIDCSSYDGRIPTGEKLKKRVHHLLSGKQAADHVIALTDVYTGSNPPDFLDASDAIAKMTQWVGNNEKFHPHAAQYDFEAWLLPYWPTIQRLAGHNRTAPSGNPEPVNHQNPPAHRLAEIFEIGRCRDSYVKPRDAGRILRENDLHEAVQQYSQLKALLNTILRISGGTVIP